MALSWNNLETITAVGKVIKDTEKVTRGSNTKGMVLLDSSMAVGDYIAFFKTFHISSAYNYWQGVHKFQGLKFDIDTPLDASGYSYVWEYYNAVSDSWIALSDVVDDTAGFTVAGVNSVTWSMPTTNWTAAYRLLNDDYYASGPCVRLRITELSSINKDAVQSSSAYIEDYSYAVWVSDGDTYTPSDIYDFMVSLGHSGLVSKSDDGKEILLNANLIVTNGTVHIYDHVRFTVGKTPSETKEWYSIESTLGGTLQLGYLDSRGMGYRGGELIWNNGNRRGNYLYWYGDVKCYGSRVWMYGYGYVGLTIFGYVEMIDSIWTRGKATSSDRWYMASGSSGKVVRSSVQNYFFYVYSPNWSFDTLSLPPGELGTSYGILAGGGAHTVKISNTDFAETLRIEVTQRSCIALIDCWGVTSSQIIRIQTVDETQDITLRYSLKITINDSSSSVLSDVVFSVFDTDGLPSLLQDLYEQEGTYVRYFDRDSSDDTGYIYNVRTGTLSVGDTVYIRSERMKIKQVPSSGNGTFKADRMQSGSVILGKHHGHDVYLVEPYVISDSDGAIKYSGTKGEATYNLITYVWARANGVDTEHDYNPFTFKARKYGYEEYNVLSTVNSKIDQKIYLYEDQFTTESGTTVSGYTDRFDINPSNKTVTVTSSGTQTQLYDYCQYWAANGSNIAYDIPITTNNGIDLNVINDWELVLECGMSSALRVNKLSLSAAVNLENTYVTGDLRVATVSGSVLSFNSVSVGGLVYNDSTTNTLTINARDCDLEAADPGTGAGQVNIRNLVSISVVVKDIEDGTPVPGARVYLKTDPDGDVVFNDLTDLTGKVETSEWVYVGDVVVVGRVRKSSSSPFYKTARLSGVITAAGYTTSVFLVKDV